MIDVLVKSQGINSFVTNVRETVQMRQPGHCCRHREQQVCDHSLPKAAQKKNAIEQSTDVKLQRNPTNIFAKARSEM